jgi:transposase
MRRLRRDDASAVSGWRQRARSVGVGIAAFVVYLLHYQLLPEDRLAELMADLFGVKLAAATIARMSRTCAERLRGFAETVRDLVAGAPVKSR